MQRTKMLLHWVLLRFIPNNSEIFFSRYKDIYKILAFVKPCIQYADTESPFTWSHLHHWATNRRSISQNWNKRYLYTLSKSNIHICNELCKSMQGQLCLLLCYTGEDMDFKAWLKVHFNEKNPTVLQRSANTKIIILKKYHSVLLSNGRQLQRTCWVWNKWKTLFYSM